MSESESESEFVHQELSYYCQDCRTHINSCACPVVVYLVVGHARPAGGEIDRGRVHPGLLGVLSQPHRRMQWCAECAPKALAALLAVESETGNSAMAGTAAKA